MEALAITDHETLADIARAHTRAEKAGIRLVIDCRLDLTDSLSVLAYPLERAAMRVCAGS